MRVLTFNLYSILGASSIVIYIGLCSKVLDVMVEIVDFCQVYGKLIGKIPRKPL